MFCRLQTKLQKIVSDQKKGCGTSRELESLRIQEIERDEEIIALKQTVSNLECKNKTLEVKNNFFFKEIVIHYSTASCLHSDCKTSSYFSFFFFN